MIGTTSWILWGHLAGIRILVSETDRRALLLELSGDRRLPTYLALILLLVSTLHGVRSKVNLLLGLVEPLLRSSVIVDLQILII